MTASEPEREDTGADRDAASAEPRPGIDPDFDYDAAFAALVAQFGAAQAPAAQTDRAAPERPETDPQSRPEPRPETDPEPGYPRELDEHYEPPEPPPLPRGDTLSRAAWAGVLGGPAVLLLAAVVGGTLPSWMVVAALAAFVAGFVTLVARMPAERDDDGDDGAVV